ncbi:MAG TPA: serpin family protein [Clostridiaceae bacterium]|nr:serpin family protein [Clostridiaceae bacterium]
MKKSLSLILIFIFLMMTAACGSQPAYEATLVDNSVVDGNNQFAFDIFKALNEEDSENNIFISPMSISSALAMAYNGAEGSTKEAMEKALGFSGIDRVLVNEGFKNLFLYLKKVDKEIDLSIANSIWIKKGEKINKDFIKNNEQKFNAKVSELDFSDPGSVDVINKWISKETKGKIEKMLNPPIDPLVVMYLVNAIYFKGEWSDPFNPNVTKDWTFHSYDGCEQTIKMMSRKDDYEYLQGKDFKAIRLPYGKGKTSMNIILPDEGVDINEFISRLDRDTWYSIRDSMKIDEVQVKIPRFTMEYGIKNLNESLKSLGMEVAFSEDADFSGICDDVFISEVLHKAIIEVNEEGSTAAAATVVAMTGTSAPVKEPLTFIADRPFIFLITEEDTGTILFMGKVLSI